MKVVVGLSFILLALFVFVYYTTWVYVLVTIFMNIKIAICEFKKLFAQVFLAEAICNLDSYCASYHCVRWRHSLSLQSHKEARRRKEESSCFSY